MMMNNYLKTSFILIFTFISLFVTAQEICGNGIDDDGDNLVDCYDGDCSINTDCDGFYFGNTVTCTDDVEVNSFAIRQQWGSADQTATSHASPAVGDLDGNGIPEVVSINNYGMLDLYVLNGATGATIASADIGFLPENAPVIADVNSDDRGDIIVSQNKGSELALYSVDINGGVLSEIWRSRASLDQSIGLPGVADFDEDGDVEIYYRNEIMSAATGTVLIAGDGNWERDYTHGSIAVDILGDAECPDCAGLELISGNEIWAINESNATRTLIRNMDDAIAASLDPSLHYYPKYYPNWDDQWSSVSVADYNLDGNMDVLLSGALGTTSEEYNGETTVFFWDVANATVITYHDPTNDFARGTGRISIGDVDGDGMPNANFVMNQKLYSLDENFAIHWIHPIREGSSGFSGCSLFDFDGDGSIEVVYRSEESLLIIDGTGNGNNTTSTKREIACISRTQDEYPVVADVDGDGSSEICVSCYFNNTIPFNPYNNTQYAHIRVFESDGEAWLPARTVWNQHGYYNVNINDDLSVPLEIQDHSVVFSAAGICQYTDGSNLPFDNRPLNTFMGQVPILNENGCTEFAAPDINFMGILSTSDATCPNGEITVEFEIANTGDAGISGSLPVSYYAENPFFSATGSMLLSTEIISLENFDEGNTLRISHVISGIGGDFELFAVINDNGSVPPLQNPLPTATIPECNTNNNTQSTRVQSGMFNLTVEKLNDNRKCDSSLPDNGSARAYYFGVTTGMNNPIWNENFESGTNGDTNDLGLTAWASNAGSETPQFYGITPYNGSKMFGATRSGIDSDVGEVTWNSEQIDISEHTNINVSMDLFEEGDLESSGSPRDFITVTYELRNNADEISRTGQFFNGNLSGNFTYNRATLTGINDSGQNDSLLQVFVVIHNTTNTEHHYFDNILVEGVSIQAPSEQTEPEGFVFNWYNNDDYATILYTGSQYAQISEGIYDVIGYYSNSGCYSDTIEIEIRTVTPDLYAWIYEVSPLDNCNIPNGSLAAFVYTRTNDGTFPASSTNIPLDTLETSNGYQFTWRLTSDATNTPIGTGTRLDNLINQSYTVDVLDNQTGCTTSENLPISSSLTFPPIPNIEVNNILACGGTGLLRASVSGNTTDFNFEWFDGPSIKPSSDATGAMYNVAGPGQYTARAIERISGCISGEVTVMVEDASSDPRPSVTSVSPNTFCENANGSIAVDGDGSGTTDGYSYRWYMGNNTLDENRLPGPVLTSAFFINDPYELGGLETDVYTVVVTDNTTSCSRNLVVDIAENLNSIIVDDIALTHINGCDISSTGFAFADVDFSGEVVNGVPVDRDWQELTSCNSVFEGNAVPVGNNGFQLTTENRFQFGRTWIGDSIDLLRPFRLDFRLYLGDMDANGADGMTFVMHRDPRGTDAAGDPGQFLGIGGTNSIEPSIAIEFDTWDNYSTIDPSYDHTAIVVNGDTQNPISSIVRIHPSNNNVENGDTLRVTVVVRQNADATQTLQLYVEESLRIEYTNDLVNNLFSGENRVIGGFTSSTGAFSNNQAVFIEPFFGEVEFAWYNSHTISESNRIDSVNTQFICDLADGDYSLVVIGPSGCPSIPERFTINRSSNDIAITTALTHNTNCTADNGAIAVTSSSARSEPAIYTYQLYEGHSFTTQIGADRSVMNGTTGTTYSDLAPGDYRIQVINDDQMCSSFEDVIINDETVIPVFLNRQTINNNSSCDNTRPNGFISVGIDGDVSRNYNFTWYNGDNSSAPVLAPSTAGNDNLNGLRAGNYTVVAEHISTGCETVELTLTIGDSPYIPNITIVQDMAQTGCTGNGELSTYIDNNPDLMPGVPSTAGLTFQWQFDGTNLVDGVAATNGSIPSGSQTSNITGLIADEYTVMITHNNTDCQASESFVLSENIIIPSITLNRVSPNTGCDPSVSNGSILVDVTPAGMYDFDWFYSSGTQVTDGGTVGGSNSNNLAGVTDGRYRVVTTSTATNCTSDTLLVVLPANPPAINFTPVTVNNTVCDTRITSGYNGRITMNLATGAIADYRYTWYDGSGTGTPTAFINNNNVLSEIPGGIYTVEIQHIASLCEMSMQVSITNEPMPPTLTNRLVNNVQSCLGAAAYPDGGLSIDTTTITGSGNYTFAFYIGSTVDIDSLLDVSNTENIFTQKNVTDPGALSNVSFSYTGTVTSISGLDEGNYTIVVTDTNTGCTSIPATNYVGISPVAININSATITHLTNCVGGAVDPNGQIQITPVMASGSEPAGGYNFQWYYGSGTSNILDGLSDLADADALSGAVANGVRSSTVSGLEQGTYTVEITNTTTNCSNTYEYEVQEQMTIPVIDAGMIVLTDNSNCSGTPTGTINATAATTPTSSAGVTYTFELLDDSDMIIATENVGTGDDGIFMELSAGNYKIRATINESGCTSINVPVEIESNTTSPDLRLTIGSDETNCTSPNGRIDITTTDPAPTGNWNVGVYRGNGTGGQNVFLAINSDLMAWNTADTLSSGAYSVQLINNTTGCDSISQITLLEVPDMPSIDEINVATTDDTFCTSDNGTITVNTVTNGGSATSYAIYTGGSSTGTPDSMSTDSIFSNLPAGTFTVTAIKTESGCESNGITQVIVEAPLTFNPLAQEILHQTSCNLSSPNGVLGVVPYTPFIVRPGISGSFIYEWFRGANTLPANSVASPTSGIFSRFRGRYIDRQPAGLYTVRVTHRVSGCFYELQQSITTEIDNPILTLGTVTDATSCLTPNGQINFSLNPNISDDLDDRDGQSYTIELYEGATIGATEAPITTITTPPNTSIRPRITNSSFGNLSEGVYSIRAIDRFTTCMVDQLNITVGYTGDMITYNTDMIFKDQLTSCFTQDGKIDFVPAISSATNITGNITIRWYIGTDVSDDANLVSNMITGVSFSGSSFTDPVTGLTVNVDSSRMENLPAISYTGVVAYANGCTEIFNTDLSISDAPTLEILNIQHPTRCSITHDGSFDIRITPTTTPSVPGLFDSPDEFNYWVFEGDQTILPDMDGTNPFNPNLNAYTPLILQGRFTNMTISAPESVTVNSMNVTNGLDSGTYTIAIEINDADRCITNVTTVTLNPPEESSVVLNTTNTFNNSICDDPVTPVGYNGQIQVDATNPAGGTFDFTWFYDADGDGDFSSGLMPITDGADGAGTGSNVAGAITANANTAVITGLGEGWYRVIAIHNDNGNIPPATACPDTLHIQLFNEPLVITFDDATTNLTQTNVLDCPGGTDAFGSFQFTNVEEDGVALSATSVGGNFTINWQYDADQDGTYEVAPFTPNNDQNDANNLARGDYRLEIISIRTRCSIDYTFTIENETEDPIIRLEATTDNSICNGGTNHPNGAIDIQVITSGGTPLDDMNYTFQWYFGTGTGNILDATDLDDGNALAGITTSNVTGLEGGSYTVEVTDIISPDQQCVATETFTIEDNLAEISIYTMINTDIEIEHQENCTGFFDGRFEVLQVYQEGTAVAVTPTNYNFQWFENDRTTTLGGSTTSATFPRGANGSEVATLPAGTYYVTATNATTDCVSDIIQFVIEDNTVNPNVQIVQDNPDESCDDDVAVGMRSGTGDITASVPGFNTGDYTFTWYEGNTAATGFDLAGPGANVIATGFTIGGTNGSVVTDLPDGTYYLEVADITDPGRGCADSETITITQFGPVLSIGAEGTDYTVQDDLNCTTDNGIITITAVNETLPGGGSIRNTNTADYVFTWFTVVTGGTNIGTGNPFDAGGMGLGVGNYYVGVTRISSECVSSSRKEIAVEDNSVHPVLSLSTSTDDTYCDNTGFAGNGELTVQISEGGSPATLSDYSIQWHRGIYTDITSIAITDADFLYNDVGDPSGSNVGDAMLGANILTLQGLSTGSYTIFIEKDNGPASPNLGCYAVATYTIGNSQPILSIQDTDYLQLANFNCTNPNGRIRIDTIRENNTIFAMSTNAANYSFAWTGPGGFSATTRDITDLQAGTYVLNIRNIISGCPVADLNIEFIIEDESMEPVLSLGSSTNDTYCDNTGFVGDGSVNVQIVEGTTIATLGDYSVEWYRGTHTTSPGTINDDFLADDGNATGTNSGNANVGDALVGPNILTMNGLSTGTYTVFITKDNGPASPNFGCSTFATYNVGSMDNIPTLNTDAIQSRTRPDSLCTGNSGVIIINDVDISTNVLNDFEIIIRQGTATATPIGTFTNTGSPQIMLTTLASGNYFITAMNTTTGCSIATSIVNVEDSVVNPLVTLVSLTPDEDCGGGVNAGALEILIDGAFDHNDHFDVQWFTGSGAVTGNEITGETEVSLTNYAAGDYSANVRNQNTDCSTTGNYTITNMEIDPSISNYTVVGNDICDDDGDGIPISSGSFEITEVSFDGDRLDQTAMMGNYQLELFKAPNLMTPITDNDATSPFIFEELDSGSYRAIITKIDSDCSSNGLDFDVEDIAERPTVIIVMQEADSTCSAAGTAKGTLIATISIGSISGIDDTDPDYNFTWYQGMGTGTPLGVTTSMITGLSAGRYTVRTERISTGCIEIGEFELPNIPASVSMEVDTTASTICSGNGIIEITSVSRDALTDYTFAFYDTNPLAGGSAVFTVPTDGPIFNTAIGGTTYYVIGTNNIIGCTTPVVQIPVEENGLVYPIRTGLTFSSQSNCNPANPNGSMTIEIDGVTPSIPDYTIQWYFGDNTTNLLDDSDIGGYGTLSGETTAAISGIPASTYTFMVTNNMTGCSLIGDLEMTDDIPNPIAISPTSSANTSCSMPNGKASVNIIQPVDGHTYEYYWFTGNLATVGITPNPATANFTGSLIQNLSEGDYVVLAVDQTDVFCQSDPTQVTVENGTILPPYELEISNVTVCFDDLDGYARISGIDLSTVDIAWYDDARRLIGNTFFIDSLDVGLYTLELTHTISRCVTTRLFDVFNDAVIPDNPSIIVNNHRTNCLVPNGSAVANVNNLTDNNYLFEWFDPADMATPYATGPEVSNLDSITYLVRATNLTSGCRSEFAQVDIKFEVIAPNYEVIYNNSICLRTEDGSTNQFTGTAIISFTDFNLATDYVWTFTETNEVVGNQSRLIDAFPGDYSVSFVAENGCTYDTTFTIGTSVTVYNGISANIDGKNDFLLIDCINYFPENNVKIFNRAGQKIYEISGYNNISKRFEGVSNTNRGGLILPVGTYFYLINLDNGEDPIQGYLELVR